MYCRNPVPKWRAASAERVGRWTAPGNLDILFAGPPVRWQIQAMVPPFTPFHIRSLACRVPYTTATLSGCWQPGNLDLSGRGRVIFGTLSFENGRRNGRPG